jgi:4-hydroxy-tetrahydrodipicolinate synthase
MLFADRPVMMTALLTPFGDQGDVDLAALSGHAEYLAGRGADGFLVGGTTGEGATLTDDEVVAMTSAVATAVRGRALTVAHVGRVATRATVGLAVRAIDAGAAAVAAVVPYFDPLSDAEIVGHYRTLATAVMPVPVYAYNIPDRTGNDLHADCLEALAASGVAGVKDSTKSMARLLEYLDAASRCAAGGHPLDVFTGADALAAESIRVGAAGSVNAIGNARPDLFRELKQAVADADQSRADKVGEQIAAYRSGLADGSFLRNLKTATAAVLAAAGVTYPTALRGPAS